MPRKARIDAPGALHHIFVRGIERRKIFLDDFDRDNFLKRLDNVLSKTATPCFAWALIANHAHLLPRTGTTAIATVMRRLLTGYAVSFNPACSGTIVAMDSYFRAAIKPFCVRNPLNG